MQSLASRLMPLVIQLRGSKRRYRSAEATLARVAERRANPASSEPPTGLTSRVDITRNTVGGWPVYTVSPKGATAARRGIYLHGGSYVFEIQRQHWSIIADLAVRARVQFTVPIFPIPPVETAETIVPKVADLTAALIEEAGSENVSIVGDSAGGGMALAVALLLRDRGIPAPHATILISPWLDISGTDPRLAEIEPRDPWLAVPGSHAAGALYRGAVNEADPLVSPLNGELAGLGPIVMFSGTRDILNADAHRLVLKATIAGTPLDYYEVPGMIHVFPLLPIPEARHARRTMVRAITTDD